MPNGARGQTPEEPMKIIPVPGCIGGCLRVKQIYSGLAVNLIAQGAQLATIA